MRTTSLQPFGERIRVFPDPAMTLAAIDRLVHHATIVEMNVKSYRRRTALERKWGQGNHPRTRHQKHSQIDAPRQSERTKLLPYCFMEECSRRRDRCLIYFAPKKTVGLGGAGRGAGRGCATAGLPVPEAGAVTVQPVSRRTAPHDVPIETAAACLLAAPGFETALKCSQRLIRIRARIFRLEPVRNSAPVRHGSALNHCCCCGVA
ncbi:hypothetical protein ABMB68_009075 [Bradyrhizobium sp. RT4a]